MKPIFFFSVEGLISTAMDRLSTTQSIKMTKTNYKSGDSATATYRALRGDYGLHNRPTKIVKKF